MAFLVSVNLSTPLCTPKTLVQENKLGRSGRGRFVRAVTSRTAMKLLAPKFLNRDAWSMNRGCCKPQVMAPSLHLCEPASPHFTVSTITPVVLLGFWVGPDIEDGWGFVEALVYQIF